MNYTQSQIERAKKAYKAFLQFTTVENENPEIIGTVEAERRAEFHNNIINEIRNGNKEIEKEWKVFFCNEEAKIDLKEAQSKAKLQANKAASANVLQSIKEMRKLGEFGKWLNTPGNPYRKQNFNKKYTEEAVNAFLNTL